MENPTDGSVVVEGVQSAGEADVDAAVAAAKKAYKPWRKTSSAFKIQCMFKMAELVEQNVDKLAKFESLCMGQPINVSKKFAGSTPAYWRYYAGFCDKLGGESYPEDGDSRVKVVQYMPYGVCAGIGTYTSLG